MQQDLRGALITLGNKAADVSSTSPSLLQGMIYRTSSVGCGCGLLWIWNYFLGPGQEECFQLYVHKIARPGDGGILVMDAKRLSWGSEQDEQVSAARHSSLAQSSRPRGCWILDRPSCLPIRLRRTSSWMVETFDDRISDTSISKTLDHS